MAAYDANDWGRRLTAMLPQSWFSVTALSPPNQANQSVPLLDSSGAPVLDSSGNQIYTTLSPQQTASTNGIIYALMYGLGAGFAFVWSLLVYAQSCLRLTTNVDLELLDLASQDFYGTNLPRLLNETAGAFALRIRQQFVLALGTLRGIQTSLNNMLRAEGSPMVATVFDAQDDPSLAATLGVGACEVGIVLKSDSNTAPTHYWAMGSQIIRGGQYGGMGYNTGLGCPGTTGEVPIDSAPDDVADAAEFAHADGTKPRYFFEYHS